MAHSASVGRSAQTETASETVVFKVAERTGSDPASLEPLYNVIDPDALDALFETNRGGPDRSSCRVAFTYCGCDVVVSAGGAVRVSEPGSENSKEEL